MPVPLTALFATAIYQVRAADSDAAAMDRALSLLARAAGGVPVRFELLGDRLMVNDMPVAHDAPGVAFVIDALETHDTARLALPANLEARHWREVASLYASAPGLFPSARAILDQLAATVPGAQITGLDRATSGDVAAPKQNEFAADAPPAPIVTPNDQRAELSVRLDPLLLAAKRAIESRDFAEVASVLLQLRELEEKSDEATRAIIARERRRTVPTDMLDRLVRLLPKHDTPPIVLRALYAIGRDGVDAMIEALNGAAGRPERRTYMEALAGAPEADVPILTALSSHRPDLVAAAAEVAGRRRMEQAIPQLGTLLKHAEEEVRTAAWHALDRIGTPAAYDALRPRGR